MLFANAEIAMVSKLVTDGGAVRLYGEFVKRNYRLAQESECWLLYRRH